MQQEQQQRPTVAAMMAGAVSGIPAYLRPAVAVPLGNLARDLDELISDLESRIAHIEIMQLEGGDHAKTD